MPTAPFSDQFVEDLKGKTAIRLEGEIGPSTFYPSFFCCDQPNDGVDPDGKEPVAGFLMSPNPALVGEDVILDSTEPTYSYDPDGSITSRAWTFESHTPSSGTFVVGTLNYGTAGTYTEQLIVTDGTGVKSLPARQELVVKYPSFDAYLATETGIYYGQVDGGTVTWSDKNTGLSGSQLQANDVKIDPATQAWAEAEKVLWTATDGGVFVSNDGGDTWADKTPGTVSNQWSDSPAPAAGSLNYMELLFTDDKLFVGSVWLNGSAQYRSWIFWTEDFPNIRTDTAGTIAWTELVTTWDD